jgi:site-specific DNA-methyltransferase (cytosine-N4-specific)
MSAQLPLFATKEKPACHDDWTFNGAQTRKLTHCYHDYPARMIPQIAGKALDLFGNQASLLFDPYCGTATSLVEGLVRGISGVGTDLNPLARLIAQAKTSFIDPEAVRREIRRFHGSSLQSVSGEVEPVSRLEGIANLGFWFKKPVVNALTIIREFIALIPNKDIKLFFRIAFSETVRECSNTRNGEFKLYRYSAPKLKVHCPNAFLIMAAKLERNLGGLLEFLKAVNVLKDRPTARIYEFDSVAGIPAHTVADESVDIVLTSPPYGDSQTTVAYGQYSRLSSAWLELPDPKSVDRRLMGGRVRTRESRFSCEPLDTAIERIAASDTKRSREVSAFYRDLRGSIQNVSRTVKPGGYACYVVGNRTVKGVQLPTDVAVRFFFEGVGFTHVDTFTRRIPNKRMPEKNSPSNVPGEVVSTMLGEFIVVMRK